MYGKVVCIFFMLLFLLAAYDPATSSASDQSVAPSLVMARSVQGGPGNGPTVVSSSGGNAHGQQVVLKDRTLVLNNVSEHDNADGYSSLITLALMVTNTSQQPIPNQSSFFMLMSGEGDTFTYQYKSSANFYGVISAHSSLHGTIVFKIPKAAADRLQLLYRPEIAAECVLMAFQA